MTTLLAYKQIAQPTVSMVVLRANRQDPTRTITLRKAFEREMNVRFARIKKNIRQAVVEQDVLGLKEPAMDYPLSVNLQPRQFQFLTKEKKIQEFMRWLNGMVEREMLTVGTLPQLGQAEQAAWSNLYVQDSYKRGVQRARYEMKNAGMAVPGIEETGGISASMSTPFHMDRVGVLYTRVFEDLKGITAAMDTQISRVLAQGMIDGDGPALLARKMRAVIDGKGLGDLGIADSLGRFIPAQRRAVMLARTEVIRAHHIGMIGEYENWKVAGVEVQAEWRTAMDDRVCEKCEGMQGIVYTLEEIRNMIPAHPQCRCIAVPTRPDLKKDRDLDEDVLEDWDPDVSSVSHSQEFSGLLDEHQLKMLQKVAEESGKSVNQIRAELVTHLKKELKGSHVVTRVTEKGLQGILRDGRFKTQFEKGTKSMAGVKNNEIRAFTEQRLFNYSSDLAVELRPVYGMVVKDASIIPGKQYGNIIIRFKNRIKNRTTFTSGDSLDATMRGQVGTLSPSPINNPSWQSVGKLSDVAQAVEGQGVSYSSLFGEASVKTGTGFLYTEAQLHGGVGVNMIESILFPTVPSSAIISRLGKLGIKWGVQ